MARRRRARCMSATSATATRRSRLSSNLRCKPDFHATPISTVQLKRASGPIRCSRRTAGNSTPQGPIFNRLRLPPISRCFPTVRRGAFCSRDGAPLASRIISRGAERRLRARREVIVCGGAFGSPQLLMVSGIGPAEQLKSFEIGLVHDAPEVGQNLQDHCDYVANLRAKGPGLFGIGSPMLTQGVGALSNYLRHGRDC